MDYAVFDKLCRDNGTTPTALAKRLGLSKGNTTSWKNGGNPSTDILIKLADELNCTTDVLLGRQLMQAFSQNETELLELFQQFDDREQIKIIGRVMEWLEVKNRRNAITQQQIVGTQVARRTDGKFVVESVTADELEKIKALPEDTDF